MRIAISAIFSKNYRGFNVAVGKGPIRSPRAVYLIKGGSRNVDDDPAVIDNLPGGTEPKTVKPIYCKMKVAIGNYFGLVALKADDIAFQGIFAGKGLNTGSKFYKNIGGYRFESYMLLPDKKFTVNELVFNAGTGEFTPTPRDLKSMNIGFPRGMSVTELLAWLITLTGSANVRAVVTPRGRKIEL